MNPLATSDARATADTRATLKDSLKRWLKLRQELIIQFNTLCQLRPFLSGKDTSYLEGSLITFCQLLLDYMSMGHFQMFEKLLANIENTTTTADIQKAKFEALKDTTLSALTFSDNYSSKFKIERLERDLSQLGEELALRFDLEDDLINLYVIERQEKHLKETRTGS